MTRPVPTAPAYCRLTVLAPRTSVDVALPADVPVADLVPMVLELVGEPARGAAPRPWRLCGAAGGLLPPAATLSQLGVLDGELLRIAPQGTTPAPPTFDDPVEAVAATADPAGTARRRCGAAAVLVLSLVASVLLAEGTVVAAFAGALVAAVGVTVVARSAGDRSLALVTALAAVPPAAAAGWALLPTTDTPVRLLLAALLAGITAVAGQVALRVVASALIGVTVAAVPVVLGCLAVAVFHAPAMTTSVAAGTLALVLGPVLPRIALRLAGLPRPVVPADSGELADSDNASDVLPPEELAERAALARGHLAGLVAGTAVVAAAGAVIAAQTGWAGPAVAAVTVAVLALRSRGYVDPTPACALLVAATATAALLTRTRALRDVDPRDPVPWGPVAAGALLLVAGIGLTAAHRGGTLSPVARRAVDFTESGLTIVAMPLALFAAGVFSVIKF
jgi:type VII secretion integral membrane protein EccD